MFSIHLIKYFNKTLIRIQFINNLIIIVIKHEVIQNSKLILKWINLM